MNMMITLLAGLWFAGLGVSKAAELPVTPMQIRAHFASPEYRRLGRTNPQFLGDVYRLVLRREPDAGGLKDWLGAMENQPRRLTREQVVKRFLRNAEYLERAASAVLSTAPRTAAELRAYFSSPEYRALRLPEERFLTDLYEKILGRAPDPGGRANWLAALQNSRIPRRQVVEAFLNSAEFQARLGASGSTPSKPTGPDGARNRGNGIFDGIGMMVAYAGVCSVRSCGAGSAERFKAAGVSWIALQIHNPGPVPESMNALPRWVQEWKAAGFKVGFWGVSYGAGAAAADARTAAKLTAEHHGDFYIANCEGPFQDKQGDVRENRAFVDAFQAEASALGIGDIPRALSSMGRVALDMTPWLSNGWDALPQAYWNDHLVYQPTLSVKFYQDWGWPAGRIHPTIATYPSTGDQKRPISLRDYGPDLKAAGTKGFSFYVPEHYLDETQYQQLVELSRQGL